MINERVRSTKEKLGRGLQVFGIATALSVPAIGLEGAVEEEVAAQTGRDIIPDIIVSDADRAGFTYWGTIASFAIGLGAHEAGTLLSGRARRQEESMRQLLKQAGIIYLPDVRAQKSKRRVS